MLQTTETIQPISQDSLTALYEIAYGLYKNTKFAQAEKCFLMLTLEQPTNRKYWMGLAGSYQMQKEFAKAVDCYSLAAAQEPGLPDAHWHAANCLYAIGNEERALTALRSAIKTAAGHEEYAKTIPSMKDLEKLWSLKLKKANKPQEK